MCVQEEATARGSIAWKSPLREDSEGIDCKRECVLPVEAIHTTDVPHTHVSLLHQHGFTLSLYVCHTRTQSLLCCLRKAIHTTDVPHTHVSLSLTLTRFHSLPVCVSHTNTVPPVLPVSLTLSLTHNGSSSIQVSGIRVSASQVRGMHGGCF